MSTPGDMQDMRLPIFSEIGSNVTITPYNRYSLLLPKRKLERFPVEFTRVLTRLSEIFGGYTFDREVSGSWIDRETGIQHVDDHVVIVVAVPTNPSSFITLRSLIAAAARELNEISIFVSVSGGPTFFIWAALHDDPNEPPPFGPCSGPIQ